MRVCLRYDPPDLADAFREICFRAPLTRRECANHLGVSLPTVYRWLHDDSAPLMARRLVVLVHGDLGGLWPDWAGCRFDGPELWTPEDTHCTLGDIRAMPYREALIEELRAQLREKVRQGSTLRETNKGDSPGPCRVTRLAG